MQHSSCRLALSLGLAALALPLALPAMAQAPKDSVVVCQTLEPPILDPAGGAAAAIREVTYDNVFETLLAFNAEGRIEPRLAEKIDSSADGLAHTITLRAGVTFHDGAALTAEDVKFSFERAMAPDSKNSQKWIFAPIDRIEARDARTVVITLKSFAGDFLDFVKGGGDLVHGCFIWTKGAGCERGSAMKCVAPAGCAPGGLP
jgi:peptide/nickel transport system substrate-binding protein